MLQAGGIFGGADGGGRIELRKVQDLLKGASRIPCPADDISSDIQSFYHWHTTLCKMPWIYQFCQVSGYCCSSQSTSACDQIRMLPALSCIKQIRRPGYQQASDHHACRFQYLVLCCRRWLQRRTTYIYPCSCLASRLGKKGV